MSLTTSYVSFAKVIPNLLAKVKRLIGLNKIHISKEDSQSEIYYINNIEVDLIKGRPIFNINI